MIQIDTENTMYVVTDGSNGEVHILYPKSMTFKHIVQLKLDDPDHYGAHQNDGAVFKLIQDHMEKDTFDV